MFDLRAGIKKYTLQFFFLIHLKSKIQFDDMTSRLGVFSFRGQAGIMFAYKREIPACIHKRKHKSAGMTETIFRELIIDTRRHVCRYQPE